MKKLIKNLFQVYFSMIKKLLLITIIIFTYVLLLNLILMNSDDKFKFKLNDFTSLNTKNFKLQEFKLVDKKMFKKESPSEMITKIYKKDNKIILIIENYMNYCSNINGSYIMESKDKYEYNRKVDLKKPKQYTINIIPKEKNYFKSQIYNCTYNILLEIDKDFQPDEIIYLLINGNIYKYNIKDIV